MSNSPQPQSFADRLLAWWHVHGRHHLPWQLERTPYRVWLAEIMLQQTQVATATPYFERFVRSFPTLDSLAAAELDEVLALWSGLGYYARARNLHASARRCFERHGGSLPKSFDELAALPGIGRSTANAILAQAFGQRAPILDGNVKRVLARHADIEGWPGHAAVLKRLWHAAENTTPKDHAANYSQAIMDLGASVCTPRRPACADCPVAEDCQALIHDRIDQLPGRRPPRRRPIRHALMYLTEDRHGQILLERRPPAGIWGGLWCLPEQWLDEAPQQPAAADLRHQFSHFELAIYVRRDQQLADSVAENAEQAWFSPSKALSLGLPRPVRTIIEKLQSNESWPASEH